MQNQHENGNREAQAFSRPGSATREDGQQRPDESTLDEQLARAEADLAQTQDAFLRARADVENIRRRAQEDLANAHKYAIENFAESLLPVMDSLEMALSVETPSVESLKEGVDMTRKQLTSAFERSRLTEVNPAPGDRFDPDRHQAISAVPSDQPPNTIVNVLQKGYLIADRLLRPALVTVARQSGGNAAGD